jgi:hypothetical protein
MLSQIITSADGRLSRTQITLCLAHLAALAVIIADAIWGDVLTLPLIATILGWHLSCHLDRMDARRIDFRISQEGAAVSMSSQEQEA